MKWTKYGYYIYDDITCECINNVQTCVNNSILACG